MIASTHEIPAGHETNCSASASKGFIVLGMHRSGTSCLAGLLETAGLWLGAVPRKCKHNKKGNLENKAVQAVNKAMLAQFGGSWRRPPKEILWHLVDPVPLRQALESYRAVPRWVLKDPRLVLTLEAWLPLIPVHQLIGTFRHPLAVAKSLQARNEIPLHDGIALWTAYNRRLVQHHKRHQFPFVNFSLLDDQYLQQFRLLCDLTGIEFNPAGASDFYSMGLVSQAGDDLIALDSETADLYDYLMGHQIRPSISARTDCVPGN
jgi:hypothetical protein